MSALSIVMLLLGTITRVLDLTAVIFCLIINYIVFSELKFNVLLVYGVTLILAFLLLPDRSVAVEYAIFALYPLLKPLIEKTGKVLSLVIKLLLMAASSVTLTLLLRFVFLLGDMITVEIIFAVALTVCYFIVDVMLTRFDLYYRYKLRRQLKIDRFFQ